MDDGGEQPIEGRRGIAPEDVEHALPWHDADETAAGKGLASCRLKRLADQHRLACDAVEDEADHFDVWVPGQQLPRIGGKDRPMFLEEFEGTLLSAEAVEGIGCHGETTGQWDRGPMANRIDQKGGGWHDPTSIQRRWRVNTICGAVLVRVQTSRHGLPDAKAALCLLTCRDPQEADVVLSRVGGTVTHRFGWVDRTVLSTAGDHQVFVQRPGADHVPVAAAFSFFAANGADPSAAFEAWRTAEPGSLASSVAVRFGPRLQHPLRFLHGRADTDEFLARNGLPCMPLDPQESIAFRQQWRQLHLDPKVFPSRLPGRPRGGQGASWTYDWDDLAAFENVEPSEAISRLMQSRAENFALFFETADLPVFLVPRAYLLVREPDWECDVYLTTYPRPGGTAIWDHEGYGPRWSVPRMG